MVFGGCNKFVSLSPLPDGIYERTLLQELMKNGDPRNIVEGGKRATAVLDRWVYSQVFGLRAILRLPFIAASDNHRG